MRGVLALAGGRGGARTPVLARGRRDVLVPRRSRGRSGRGPAVTPGTGVRTAGLTGHRALPAPPTRARYTVPSVNWPGGGGACAADLLAGGGRATETLSSDSGDYVKFPTFKITKRGQRAAKSPLLPEVGRRANPRTWPKWSTVASPGSGLPSGCTGPLRTAGRGLVAQGDGVRHLALRIGNRAITAFQGQRPTRRATRQGCGRLHPGRPHSTSGSSDARDVGRHHPGGPHARTACRGRLE